MSVERSNLIDDHLLSLQGLFSNPDSLSVEISDRIAYTHDASPLALKRAASGVFPHIPDVIVWPETPEQVSALLCWAQTSRVPVIPYGGGSGIVGGALPLDGGLVIDLKRLNRILSIDHVSMVATVEAGINGQLLEDGLNALGYTLGHFPQSIRASTLGGWIAHRAAGVASTRYGKIEDIVQALNVVLPTGELIQTRSIPRSSTGPDLNQLFLGAEGAYGVVTSADLAIRPIPETRTWQAYAFADFGQAIDCVRQVIQRDYRPAIVRLYDAEESAPHLAGTAAPTGSVLLLWGSEGSRQLVAFEQQGIRQICDALAVQDLGPEPGEKWWSHRFSTTALLRTLQKPSSVADALEVTASWGNLLGIYHAMKRDMAAATGEGGRVYGHVSHVYHTGANLYMIFHAAANDEDDVPLLYDRILDAAFTACLGLGGSLSHHHGVGSTKAKWLPSEHGKHGLRVLREIQQTLDPGAIMNPGVGFHGGTT